MCVEWTTKGFVLNHVESSQIYFCVNPLANRKRLYEINVEAE